MESIWESFDAIFKTCFRQGRKIDELEQRIAALESKLSERAPIFSDEYGPDTPDAEIVMPAENEDRHELRLA